LQPIQLQLHVSNFILIRNGVCLWKLLKDERSIMNDNAASDLDHSMNPWMKFLSVSDLTGVSTVAWSPCGRILVVGYNSNPSLIVWDVCSISYTRLSRGTFSGTKGLIFSPDGNYLLQTISGSGINVWETFSWNMQRLSTSSECTVLAY
jgi:WD40 repeat protein